jgi:predicted aconitase
VHLTKDEEHIFDGERGWANQICMKILVRLGELFKAQKLIPIDSAHISGVSYKTLGDAPIEFLQALADAGGRTRVKATLNPQSLDPKYLLTRLPKAITNKQLTILKQFDKMGVTQSLTCTPYYLVKPEHSSHLAWAESSAVIYANSVLGACTNREGGPSALAAAIIGKTPDYGMHVSENRRPNISVNVETKLQDETEFGALGILLGRILADKIPVIQGLENASESDLKQLSAALGSTGMTNMFHLIQDSHQIKKEKLQKINVETQDIKRTIESLTTASTQKPDLIFIGCPHCSRNELAKIACLAQGKKIKPQAELWVCTSRHVKQQAAADVEKIEGSGGHVLTDVCTIVSWTEMLGIKTIMTNSAKTAHYAPTLSKAETILAPLTECLKTAFQG